jgi:hypothetical protein
MSRDNRVVELVRQLRASGLSSVAAGMRNGTVTFAEAQSELARRRPPNLFSELAKGQDQNAQFGGER